jgi:hypothetical protein
MRIPRVVSLAVLVAALSGGLGLVATAEAPARHDVLHTCGCGTSCGCKTASLTPGRCSCGKDPVWGHVVKVEGNVAFVCSCKKDCTCKLDPKDPSKCGCGHALKRVSLEGTGF